MEGKNFGRLLSVIRAIGKFILWLLVGAEALTPNERAATRSLAVQSLTLVFS